MGDVTERPAWAAELAVGQVWAPVARGGMWRTIVAIHPAGVEWTTSCGRHEFHRWVTWRCWMAETEAQLRTTPAQISREGEG